MASIATAVDDDHVTGPDEPRDMVQQGRVGGGDTDGHRAADQFVGAYLPLERGLAETFLQVVAESGEVHLAQLVEEFGLLGVERAGQFADVEWHGGVTSVR